MSHLRSKHLWAPCHAAALLALLSGPSAVCHAATFSVTHVNDSGVGSLRAAIESANATADADVVAFAIPGNGPFTITPQTSLPTITQALLIDGYSQTGALANTLQDGDDAVIQIAIDGDAITTGSRPGLALCASGSVLRGLSITRFRGNGIQIGRAVDDAACATEVSNAVVEGSFIGLAADGTARLIKRRNGIEVFASFNARIGGPDPASRNLITGNSLSGVATGDPLTGANGVTIDGNTIGSDRSGVDRSGLLSSGNTFGLSLGDGTRDARIGSQRRNLIATNLVGMSVSGAASGNTFFRNDFMLNEGAGTDLCATTCSDGSTANDVDDADSGGNDLQNHPVISAASRNAAGVQISGSLDRIAASGTRSYTIAVYAGESCLNSGRGEGGRLLGQFDFVSAFPLAQSFSRSIATTLPLPVGTVISATATDLATGNTSEFSECIGIDNVAPIVVTNTNDTGGGSLRNAINFANALAGADTIVFAIAGSGVKTIAPLSLLPPITDALLIDGYTQAGAAPNTLASGSNAELRIEVDAAAHGLLSGLTLDSENVSIRGISLYGAGSDDVAIFGASTTAVVEGSFLGLRADGISAPAVPASTRRILLGAGSGHRIGGALPAQRNLFAGGGNGILVVNAGTSDVEIDGNSFGTDRGGNLARGNDRGIAIVSNAHDVRVGARARNRFRFNAVGILVDASAAGVDIRANDISDSSVLGIDLSAQTFLGDGLTANDANDADSGGNGLQNFPVLVAADALSGRLRFSGRLDVAAGPAVAVLLAFHASAVCHPTGFGEGTAYLGSSLVAVANADENFVVEIPGTPPQGNFITATATRAGNTSEFSACIALVADRIFRDGYE